MNIERKERGQYPMVQVAYLPTPCMHCQEAPCMADSPAGTIYRREDGLVIIDPEKAKGHPEIVDTCPYGAIYWNEEAQVPRSAPAAPISSTRVGRRLGAPRYARPAPSSWSSRR